MVAFVVVEQTNETHCTDVSHPANTVQALGAGAGFHHCGCWNINLSEADII